MGAFGQGGSATYGFSRATIIVSRRHPACLDGKPDRVGWTIVREFFDAATMKLPNYSYYAPAGADGVFELDPALLPDLPHGTRIIHVAYDLQGAATTYTTGIWQLYNAALFDPVLPFIVGGVGRYNPNKSTGDKPDTRVITGNATRLAGIDKARGDIEAAHSESVELELGAEYGSVRINYWVLARSEGSTSRSDVTAGYVKADSAVVMTLFGQRQDQLPRTWIKDNAKLPYLFKNMIVQIDADGLTPIAKRELFASTRERATDSDLRRDDLRLPGEAAARGRRAGPAQPRREGAADEPLDGGDERQDPPAARQVHHLAAARGRQGRRRHRRPPGGKAPQPKPQSKPAGVVRPKRSTDDSALPKVPTYIRFEKEQVRLVQGGETGVLGRDQRQERLPRRAQGLAADHLARRRRGHDQGEVEVSPEGRPQPLVHRLHARHRGRRVQAARRVHDAERAARGHARRAGGRAAQAGRPADDRPAAAATRASTCAGSSRPTGTSTTSPPRRSAASTSTTTARSSGSTATTTSSTGRSAARR